MAKVIFRKLNVAKDLSWTPGNVDSLVEVLGVRDMVVILMRIKF